MQALRLLLLIWLGVSLVAGVAAMSPIRFYGFKLLLGFGMILQGLPFAALVAAAMAVQGLAFCYVWATRPA